MSFLQPIYQMTAQDIDLIPFSSSDSKRLRDKIDSLNIDATLKVRMLINIWNKY